MTRDELISLPEKISLVKYPHIRYMIRENRKENRNNYTAEELSVEIGKSKSWLAQIENGRLNSIMKSDLYSIISKLSSPSASSLYEDIEDETISTMNYYEDKYQSRLQDALYEEEGKLPLNEDTLIKRDLVKIIFDIKNTILNNCNNLTIDEKKKLLNSLTVLNKNLININLTCSLLALPIHAINDNNDKNSNNEKRFVSEINTAFTNYLSSSLNS